MHAVPLEALAEALNEDGEFRHAARYWDASVRLGIGDAPLCIEIQQGRVAGVRPAAPSDVPDLSIDAPASEWEALLAPVPRPFYQSIQGAAIHHDVEIGGDPLVLFAYLAAVTRLFDVLRAQVGEGR